MFSFNLIFPLFISDSVGSIGLSNMRAYDVGTSRFGVHGRRYAMRMRPNNREQLWGRPSQCIETLSLSFPLCDSKDEEDIQIMNIFQNIVEKFRHVEALKKVVRFPVKNSMIYKN